MILVFVGAGGSAAVDPKQYPTTLEFFNGLLNSITNNPLFTTVHKFLTEPGKKKKGDVNIEDILGTLKELQEKGREAIDTKTILGGTLAGKLGFINGVSFDSFSQSVNQLIEAHAVPLVYEIHRRVYELYAEEPNPDQLEDWVSLLSGLAEIDPDIEIFTTNYDLVLENLIPQVGLDIKTGRHSDGKRTQIDVSPWETSILNDLKPSGLLTKLHGSVDWQYGRNGGINISDTDTGNDDKQCILYPGHKGEPTKEPFKTFHEYLHRVIRSETLSAVVFVGFAFGDDYINELLSDLPKHIHGVFFTRDDPNSRHTNDPPERAPQLDHYIHFPAGLTKESVLLCLRSFQVKFT